MTYTEQAVEDVLFAQRVNHWIGNAKAGNFGREAQSNATPAAAIRDEAVDAGEKMTASLLTERLQRYERGNELASRFVLVESTPQAEANERTEAFFCQKNRIAGPVVWRNAGYVATSPRYVAVGLRHR